MTLLVTSYTHAQAGRTLKFARRGSYLSPVSSKIMSAFLIYYSMNAVQTAKYHL